MPHKKKEKKNKYTKIQSSQAQAHKKSCLVPWTYVVVCNFNYCGHIKYNILA